MRLEGDDDSVALTQLNLTPIEVDIDGLEDFRAFLGRELDTNLKPGAQGIVYDHGMGVHFGARNPGTSVQAARLRYHDSLEASTANLAAYVEVAEVLIDTMRRVATKYRDADLSAAATSAPFTAELNAALVESLQVKQEAIARERDQETQRELNRLNAGTDR